MASKGKGPERGKKHDNAESDKQKASEEAETNEPSAVEAPRRETWASRLKASMDNIAKTAPAAEVTETSEETPVEVVPAQPEAQPEQQPEQEAGEPVVSEPRVVRGPWGDKAALEHVKSSKPVIVKKQPAEAQEKVAEPQPEPEAEPAQPETVAEPEVKEQVEEPKVEEKSEVTEPTVTEPAAPTKRGIHFGLKVKEESKSKFKFGASSSSAPAASAAEPKSKHMTGGELEKFVLDSIQNTNEEPAPAPPAPPAAKAPKPKREPRQPKEKKEPVAEEAPKEAEKVENTPVVPTPPPNPPANSFGNNYYAQMPNQLQAWMQNPAFMMTLYHMFSGSGQMMQPGMAPGAAFPNAHANPADLQHYFQNSQISGDGPGATTHGMGDFSSTHAYNSIPSNFGQGGFNMGGHVSTMPYASFGQTDGGNNKGNFSQGSQQQNRNWNNQTSFSTPTPPFAFNSAVGGQNQHSGQTGQFPNGNFQYQQYGYDNKGFFDKGNQGANAQAPGLKQNTPSQGTYSYNAFNPGSANQSPNFNNAQSETSSHLNSVPSYNYTNSYSGSSGQAYFRQN